MQYLLLPNTLVLLQVPKAAAVIGVNGLHRVSKCAERENDVGHDANIYAWRSLVRWKVVGGRVALVEG